MITWKQLDRNSHEGENKKYDFHISIDRHLGCVVLDIFKKSVKDADAAHVSSDTYPDVETAKSEAEKHA